MKKRGSSLAGMAAMFFLRECACRCELHATPQYGYVRVWVEWCQIGTRVAGRRAVASPIRGRVPLNFLSLSIPRPSIFSRIFANIENIFVTRQVDGGQKSLQIYGCLPKTARDRSKLKDFSLRRPKTYC